MRMCAQLRRFREAWRRKPALSRRSSEGQAQSSRKVLAVLVVLALV